VVTSIKQRMTLHVLLSEQQYFLQTLFKYSNNRVNTNCASITRNRDWLALLSCLNVIDRFKLHYSVVYNY